MKIYTYYQDINFSNQNELIDLWKISWSRQGYEPIVLNLEHAKKHPYFETLNSEMPRIFKEITNKEIGTYGMSCWFRWLAYATQKQEKFYVSDYDAINANFPITEPEDKLHFMDSACPFLASGTPRQFENLCKAFIEISNERMHIIKKQANHYHDQEFFQYNFLETFNPAYNFYKNKYEIMLTRNRRHIGGKYDPVLKKMLAGPYMGYMNVEDCKVFHISHYCCGMMLNKYPQLKDEHSKKSLRIQMIKDILNIK